MTVSLKAFEKAYQTKTGFFFFFLQWDHCLEHWVKQVGHHSRLTPKPLNFRRSTASCVRKTKAPFTSDEISRTSLAPACLSQHDCFVAKRRVVGWKIIHVLLPLSNLCKFCRSVTRDSCGVGRGSFCTQMEYQNLASACTQPVHMFVLLSVHFVVILTLSLLRVINVKIPLQPHKKYDITQYGELDFS